MRSLQAGGWVGLAYAMNAVPPLGVGRPHLCLYGISTCIRISKMEVQQFILFVAVRPPL